jgi:hypothetical protein
MHAELAKITRKERECAIEFDIQHKKPCMAVENSFNIQQAGNQVSSHGGLS